MEQWVPCRVASSPHLWVKEVQVQLVVLKERTGRCSKPLLPPVAGGTVTEGERFTAKTGAGWQAAKAEAYVRATADL